jgi:hypothetical protein
MPEAVSGTFTQSPAATAFSTLYARVRNYVMGPDDAEVTTIAKEGINEAIARLNTRVWTWTRVHKDITLVAGTQEYALESNCKSPRSMQVLDTAGEVRGTLGFLDPKELDRLYGDRAAQGQPEHYTINNMFDNGKVTLSTTPTSSYVAVYSKLRFRYFKRLAYLSADADLFSGPTEVEPFLVWHGRALVASHWAPEKLAYADARAEKHWQELVRDDRLQELRDWSNW